MVSLSSVGFEADARSDRQAFVKHLKFARENWICFKNSPTLTAERIHSKDLHDAELGSFSLNITRFPMGVSPDGQGIAPKSGKIYWEK